jgi:LPS-assembly protein
LILRADSLTVRPDLDATAEGHVEFRRAGTVIQADKLVYDSPSDLVVAKGKVQITREGVVYRGPELQLKVQRFEGFFLQPEFEFVSLGAGGRAERIDFLDSARSRAQRMVYSSCPRDGSDQPPDWVLNTARIKLDFDTNEGIAEGAVLRFLGVPILGLPVLSFPLNDERKSGWLPPTVVPQDSRNGFTVGVPYYWNIAPNRDATITPTIMTRRGAMVDGEFRYLEPTHEGRIKLNLLPADQVTGGSRHAWDAEGSGLVLGDVAYRVKLQRVSDDGYWKDFPRLLPSTAPRLLPQDFEASRQFNTALGGMTTYARVQQWQVLQTGTGDDLIVSPYQRSPQIGLRWSPLVPATWRASLETEVNHFTRGDGSASAALPTGWRWHALGQISRPYGDAGWWLNPKLSLNAAAYDLDQADAPRRHAARWIPTASVDAGLVLERSTSWFGRPQRQTLEPRLLYVNTPFRDQSTLPSFDAAERDFNALSIYNENSFAGIDRVSDANQVTTGFTTRLVDEATGAETLRLGLAQRFRFRDQRVVASGEALSQRVSDVLLEGSTSVFNPWKLDAALQYNPDTQRVVRSIVGVRFSPGPFQTLSAGYRLARGSSEQVELGWQWPLYHGTAQPVGAANGCGGTLYAVGRMNYSRKDRRMTDSIAGFEYDAGCWIARIVSERLSTGRAEATTRTLLQLELVGLSRLGSSPLQVLKDNIPGYRLLREPRSTPFPTPEP